MSNNYFQFKQFLVKQDRCAMKVTTDACLFGAWAAEKIRNEVLKAKTILDIGTGTGILSLMLAQKTKARIDAIELEQNALEQAKENFTASPWNDRLNIFHGDAREFKFTHDYEAIISNPPFYENELSSPDKEKNLAHHAEGLLLNELLQVIYKSLSSKGRFYLLLPYKRIMETGLLLEKNHFHIAHAVFVKQSPQHNPFRVFIAGKYSRSSKAPYTKTEITIRDEKGEYTEEFSSLLKDYYLYL